MELELAKCIREIEYYALEGIELLRPTVTSLTMTSPGGERRACENFQGQPNDLSGSEIVTFMHN